MTKLTEVLLKGNARAPNKTYRKYGNKMFNHRIMATPVLQDKVSNKSDRASKETQCVEQMQQLMGCWKLHDFKEQTCLEELAMYGKCVQEAKAASERQRELSATESLGDGERVNQKQANKLLRMFPQPPYKINLTQAYGYKLHQPLIFEGKQEDKSINQAPSVRRIFKPYSK